MQETSQGHSSPPSRSCASATPSEAGCASPATATSPGRSSGRYGGRGCRSPTRRASAPIRGSPMRTPRPRGRPARRSTWRSPSSRRSTRRRTGRCSTRRCPPGWTSSRSSMARGGLARRPAGGQPLGGRAPAGDRPDAAGGGRRRSSRPTVEVERMAKSGLRRFDCRAAVVRMSVRGDVGDSTPCAILELVVRHGTPAVRPDDILAGLRDISGPRRSGSATADPDRARAARPADRLGEGSARPRSRRVCRPTRPLTSSSGTPRDAAQVMPSAADRAAGRKTPGPPPGGTTPKLVSGRVEIRRPRRPTRLRGGASGARRH